jgi:nucleoid DNA-binding protein
VTQQNPITVKLAPLLAEYLYTNKQLDLPGIGTFRIESSDMPDTEDRKQAQPVSISFQSNPSTRETPELISFIASKAGKMKALAASDLESHLQIIQQFLNIGKPFLMEGIGSLSKLRSGQYEFTQGDITVDKIKEVATKELSSAVESLTDYAKTSSTPKTKPGKLLPLLLIVTGIAIAVWVGYRIYQKRVSRNNDDTTKVNETKKDETVPVITDSSQVIKITDTTKKTDTVIAQKPMAVAGTYRFVVEEATKERALLRYNSLKSWGLPLQMETHDSVNFKLFFILPSSVADTAKTMDSLRILYTPVWSKSYVEK